MAVRRFTALNPVGKGYRAGYSARTDGRVTASHRGTPIRRSGALSSYEPVTVSDTASEFAKRAVRFCARRLDAGGDNGRLDPGILRGGYN
jgi:hypothetical protein